MVRDARLCRAPHHEDSQAQGGQSEACPPFRTALGERWWARRFAPLPTLRRPCSGVSKDEAGGKAICLPRLAPPVLLSRAPQRFRQRTALFLRLAWRG